MDQYSSAATLYWLLTSRHTHDFPEEAHACLTMLLTKPMVPLLERRADIPHALVAAVERGLAREPEKRYPSCGAFAEALARLS